MLIKDLPSIHFLSDTGNGLKAPKEYQEAKSGDFYIPIKDDISPFYRFDYSIYLGNGEFYKENGEVQTLVGLAANTNDGLSLFFNRKVEKQDELLIPILKPNKRKKFKYIGGFEHDDFENYLIKLTEDKILDALLDNFGLIVAGCNYKELKWN